MFQNVKLLIVDPEEFMRAQLKEAPLWQPTFLILLGGIFQSFPTFLILNRANISGGLQGTVLGVAQLVGVISGLLLLLSIWLAIAVVLHVVTSLLGAETGELSETFQ